MSGPDYSSYTLEELEDARAHVNREKYPERYNQIIQEIAKKSEHITKYKCIKCGHKLCDIEELRATGGDFSQLFDVQNMKYTTVTCKQCKYTEFYKCDSDKMMGILDFIFGG